MADVDALSAEPQQALQLLIRAAAVGAQVQVQSILDRFAFRYGKHVDRRPGSIGRGDADAVLVNLDLPPQDGASEVGYDSWLLRVDGYDCDATGHDPHFDVGVDPGLRPRTIVALPIADRSRTNESSLLT